MCAYEVIQARPQDVGRLAAIELAANALLADWLPPSRLHDTTNPDELEEARREGRLFVALADDVPVGFAHVRLIEPAAVHLEEMDVHPDHGRRGLGTRLVGTVCDWAEETGRAWVTLTTFRDVPFNMPFYARLGFEVIPPGDLGSALRAVVADEARRGLDPATRVAMRRAVGRRDDATARRG